MRSAHTALELVPVDEVEKSLAIEPCGDCPGKPAAGHRLLGRDVEARANRLRSRKSFLERLGDIIRVHVMQHAEAERR